MEAFFYSTTLVALAEIGDKTQLLSLMLAVRFKRPWTIIFGIFAATAINHALAGAIGAWIKFFLGDDVLRYVVGISFLAMAAWMLIPDKLDDGEVPKKTGALGVFGITFVAFFLAEMGDKTQIATITLAAQYKEWLMVVIGTTFGMMIANAPVVWLGGNHIQRVPVKLVHAISAIIFALLGAFALFGKHS